jgi:hypothetical protein
MRAGSPGRLILATAIGAALTLGPAAFAQSAAGQAPAAASASKAKELIGLMQSKKLEAIAARDPDKSGRYLAALLIPNVQLLVVSATYAKPSDLDARLYYKDFMGAYVDLNTSIHSSDKTFIEDALCDGLIAQPGKSLVHDSARLGAEKRIFDGDFAAPNQKNSKKISQDAYLKLFSTAEEQYIRVLGVLIEEAKKQGEKIGNW